MIPKSIYYSVFGKKISHFMITFNRSHSSTWSNKNTTDGELAKSHELMLNRSRSAIFTISRIEILRSQHESFHRDLVVKNLIRDLLRSQIYVCVIVCLGPILRIIQSFRRSRFEIFWRSSGKILLVYCCVINWRSSVKILR